MSFLVDKGWHCRKKERKRDNVSRRQREEVNLKWVTVTLKVQFEECILLNRQYERKLVEKLEILSLESSDWQKNTYFHYSLDSRPQRPQHQTIKVWTWETWLVVYYKQKSGLNKRLKVIEVRKSICSLESSWVYWLQFTLSCDSSLTEP